jgi:hypothetical protein
VEDVVKNTNDELENYFFIVWASTERLALALGEIASNVVMAFSSSLLLPVFRRCYPVSRFGSTILAVRSTYRIDNMVRNPGQGILEYCQLAWMPAELLVRSHQTENCSNSSWSSREFLSR